jgi:hypothetical protein
VSDEPTSVGSDEPDDATGPPTDPDVDGDAPTEPDPHEDVTEPVVAEEESERDDAGRDADEPGSAGWRLQAQIFGTVGVFIALIGVIYWIVSAEHVGTTLLALTATMALLTAVYVGYPRKSHPLGPGEPVEHEPGHDPHDGVWFPEASIWPFAIGGGMVLVANGLLLGLWLLLPAAIFLLWALAGMIRQGRERI